MFASERMDDLVFDSDLDFDSAFALISTLDADSTRAFKVDEVFAFN